MNNKNISVYSLKFNYIINLYACLIFYDESIKSIRFNIYKINEIFYIDYYNKSYILNLPEKFKKMDNLCICLFDTNFKQYDIKNPEYLFINNEKIKNNNIINLS
jgi:hypothetical protein